MTSKAEQIFFEIHSNNLSEGPGNFESTRKAFDYLAGLPDHPRILDLGCGPGRQTLDLAALSHAWIYVIDLYGMYLNQLKRRIDEAQLKHYVFPVNCDMKFLPFQENVFDVIWGEGSIYLTGFEKGLILWKSFLKPGGYLVVSEISWLRDNPPCELQQYWNSSYPAMNTIPGNLASIENRGYKLSGYFVLPDNAWWNDYYGPLESKISRLMKCYREDPKALKILEAEEIEMEMFRRYSDYFGYVFFIMQKP